MCLDRTFQFDGEGRGKEERACFIGADDRDGAESFDRMKLFDDRLALGHAQHTKSERHSRHDWQAFWDGRNGQ